MNYREALSALKNDQLNNCLILQGEEPYLIEDFIQKMKEHYGLQAEGDINVLSVDASDSLPEGFYDFVFGMPFFSEHKLLIVRHAQKLKLEKNTWAELREIDSSTKIVFLPDENKESYKNIAAISDVVDMKKISRDEMEKWIIKQLRLSEKKITREGLARLISYSRYFEFRSTTDLHFLKKELDKLVSTDEEVITLTRLDQMLGRPNEDKVFDLIGFISQKDARNALLAFDEYVKSGAELPRILSMLARNYYQLHILRKLFEEGLPLATMKEKIGQKSDFLAKKLLGTAKRSTSEELLHDLNLCLEKERIFKSESVQIKAHLEALILELLQ